MAANKLRRRLPVGQWAVTVVDQTERHVYQPGLLFLPFGGYRPEQLVKRGRDLLIAGVRYLVGEIERVLPEAGQVRLCDGRLLTYDYLVVATGTTPRPDQTPGMLEDMGGDVHEFYTFEGSQRLADKLRTWSGGRLVVHVAEMPIKCPVAPLEFAFLADAYFADKGVRDRVDMTYVTPLEGAFTKPVASRHLGGMLEQRRIALEADFMVESLDPVRHVLVSYDEREVPYDLLVTVPVNMGADYIERSGLGDELNYVPVDKGTLLSTAYDNIFAIGDASNIPASKAGSVAHFSVDGFVDNFFEHVNGQPMRDMFDGHANCFVETGHRKGMLIDFNYEVEPLTGNYPLPGIGPFPLLSESRRNHWGKLFFRWMYWHVLLPGRRVPLPDHMSMAGKHPDHPAAAASAPVSASAGKE
jgi:sulfide:quinone oxidoreductase